MREVPVGASCGFTPADPIWQRPAPPVTREQLRFVIPWIVPRGPIGDTVAPRRLLELSSFVVARTPGDHADVEELGLGRAMAALAAAGVPVLGHVETSNGYRPLTAVTAEIVRWLKRRHADGILLGNVRLDGEDISTLRIFEYVARVRGASLVAATCPGYPPHRVVDMFDMCGVFGGRIEDHKSLVPPPWAKEVAPKRLWHLVHNVPITGLSGTLDRVRSMGVGNVSVTSSRGPNMWDGATNRLIPYLAALASSS